MLLALFLSRISIRAFTTIAISERHAFARVMRAGPATGMSYSIRRYNSTLLTQSTTPPCIMHHE